MNNSTELTKLTKQLNKLLQEEQASNITVGPVTITNISIPREKEINTLRNRLTELNKVNSDLSS